MEIDDNSSYKYLISRYSWYWIDTNAISYTCFCSCSRFIWGSTIRVLYKTQNTWISSLSKTIMLSFTAEAAHVSFTLSLFSCSTLHTYLPLSPHPSSTCSVQSPVCHTHTLNHLLSVYTCSSHPTSHSIFCAGLNSTVILLCLLA